MCQSKHFLEQATAYHSEKFSLIVKIQQLSDDLCDKKSSMPSCNVSKRIPVDIFLRKSACRWSSALLVEQLLSRSPRRESAHLKESLSHNIWVITCAANLDTSLRLFFWKLDLPPGRTYCRCQLFLQERRLIKKMSTDSKLFSAQIQQGQSRARYERWATCGQMM